MKKKVENFLKQVIKKDLPAIRAGDTVRIHQKIKEGDKERIQIFEGLVLTRKHGKEAGSTITVRKIISGVGVEKIIPLHSPTVQKIEIVKSGKVRRAKLYYLRNLRGKKAGLKKKEFAEVIAEDKPKIEEIKKLPIQEKE
jgi:large subunit ribosomal protein L19